MKEHIEPKKKKISSNCVPVIAYDKDGNVVGKWESMTKAAAEVGCHSDDISRCTVGAIPICAGYTWKRQGADQGLVISKSNLMDPNMFLGLSSYAQNDYRRLSTRNFVNVSNQISDILDIVCEEFNVDLHRITTPGRGHMEISNPRQVAMFLMNYQMGIGPSRVARVFRKNHATVIHATRKCLGVLRVPESDREFHDKLQKCIKRFVTEVESK